MSTERKQDATRSLRKSTFGSAVQLQCSKAQHIWMKRNTFGSPVGAERHGKHLKTLTNVQIVSQARMPLLQTLVRPELGFLRPE